ncbi:MAG: type I-C CRISPR-associated protein Cas5c, partial [Treponemataceae bacterium]|nr:type I-C CRISPR-associated protein Cas5c [Treponemataceae bacterium]
AYLVFIPLQKRKETKNPLPEYLVDSAEKEALRSESQNGPSTHENPAKYNAMFERRAKKGQCFFQPYLGCREFSCFFKLVDPEREQSEPIHETRDLGFMLYDMDYSDPHNITPAFFNARIENGVVRIPNWNSEEVRK